MKLKFVIKIKQLKIKKEKKTVQSRYLLNSNENGVIQYAHQTVTL